MASDDLPELTYYDENLGKIIEGKYYQEALEIKQVYVELGELVNRLCNPKYPQNQGFVNSYDPIFHKFDKIRNMSKEVAAELMQKVQTPDGDVCFFIKDDIIRKDKGLGVSLGINLDVDNIDIDVYEQALLYKITENLGRIPYNTILYGQLSAVISILEQSGAAIPEGIEADDKLYNVYDSGLQAGTELFINYMKEKEALNEYIKDFNELMSEENGVTRSLDSAKIFKKQNPEEFKQLVKSEDKVCVIGSENMTFKEALKHQMKELNGLVKLSKSSLDEAKAKLDPQAASYTEDIKKHKTLENRYKVISMKAAGFLQEGFPNPEDPSKEFKEAILQAPLLSKGIEQAVIDHRDEYKKFGHSHDIPFQTDMALVRSTQGKAPVISLFLDTDKYLDNDPGRLKFGYSKSWGSLISKKDPVEVYNILNKIKNSNLEKASGLTAVMDLTIIITREYDSKTSREEKVSFKEFITDQVEEIAEKLKAFSGQDKNNNEYKILCLKANAFSEAGFPIPKKNKIEYFKGISKGARIAKDIEKKQEKSSSQATNVFSEVPITPKDLKEISDIRSVLDGLYRHGSTKLKKHMGIQKSPKPVKKPSPGSFNGGL